MTARQCFEGLLTELSKVNAPSMLLQDFNYFFNKAINLYTNKQYNVYDVNLQTTDNLRVLKSTATLKPKKVTENSGNLINSNIEDFKNVNNQLYKGTYEVNLPLDYVHLLNCICIYKVKKRYKCFDPENIVQYPATRLTADSWSTIINNFFTRPLPERPYYYIHNINQKEELPTNPVSDTNILSNATTGTDSISNYANNVTLSKNNLWNPETSEGTNLPRTISLNGIDNKSLVEREAGVRYGNSSNVRMEIRYGYDDSVFELVALQVDYIKAPLTIRLTQEQVNLTEDTSQIMEFPDYVCQEIINELVHLVLENIADPRLLTNIPVTQSIATPAQQLTVQPNRK